MKYTYCFFLGLFFVSASAQNYIDILEFSYAKTPQNNFNNSTESTDIQTYDFQFTFPIVLNKTSTLITGIFVNKDLLKLDENTADKRSLTKLGLKLGVNHVYSNKWSGTYMLLPSIASDFEEISSDDYQIGLFSLLTYKKKENLKYKFGFYANTEKYGLFMVPIIGLYYKSTNDKFEANLSLPVQFDVNYELFPKIKTGLNFDGLGSSYNLNKQAYSPNNAYVTKSSNELFSYLQFKLGKSLIAKTKLGYAISRSYKAYDSNDKIDFGLSSFYFGDDRAQLNQNFEEGPIFKIELLYRLHFN